MIGNQPIIQFKDSFQIYIIMIGNQPIIGIKEDFLLFTYGKDLFSYVYDRESNSHMNQRELFSLY